MCYTSHPDTERQELRVNPTHNSRWCAGISWSSSTNSSGTLFVEHIMHASNEPHVLLDSENQAHTHERSPRTWNMLIKPQDLVVIKPALGPGTR